MSITKTPDGWHNFTESGAFVDGKAASGGPGVTRRVFVAAPGSGGSDSNAGTAASPLATIATALTFIRAGFPDWLLLNQGDTFTLSAGVSFNSGVGLNANEPALITAYSAGTPYWRLPNPAALARPVIKGGSACAGISSHFNSIAQNFFVIAGIELYASARDPNSADWDPANARATNPCGGILLSFGRVDYCLIEDCWVHYYTGNIGESNDNFYSGDIIINDPVVRNVQITNGTSSTSGITVGQRFGLPGWDTNQADSGNYFPPYTTVTAIDSVNFTVTASNSAIASTTGNHFLPYYFLTCAQLILNRTIITDAYSFDQNHSQGLYYYDGGTQNFPLTVNECVFDHNGWNENLTVSHGLGVNVGTSTFTWTDNNWYLGFVNNDAIQITGGTLPTGIILNNIYYLKNLSTNTFQLSSTPGGSVITLSGSASGVTAAWQATNAVQFNHNNYLDNVTYFTGNISARPSLQGCQIRAGGLSFNNSYIGCPGQGFIGGGDLTPGVMAYNVATEHTVNPGTAAWGIEVATGKGIRTLNCISANSTTGVNNSFQYDSPAINCLLDGNIAYNTGPNTIIYNGNDLVNITHATTQPNTDSKGTVVSNCQIANSAGSYPDPTRNSASYSTSIGGAATQLDFLTKARANRRGAWNKNYTADSYNNYIRAGFGVPMKRVPFGLHA